MLAARRFNSEGKGRFHRHSFSLTLLESMLSAKIMKFRGGGGYPHKKKVKIRASRT